METADPRKEIADMAALLAQAPRRHASFKVEDAQEVRCQNPGCGKMMHISEMPIISTGVVNYISDLCAECRKTLQDLAIVVCVNPGCGEVARVTPYVDSSGFKFQKGRHYHMRACPKCVKGLAKSPVIELEIHLQRTRQRSSIIPP